MSQPNQKSGRKHSRHASFHQRQVRFFIIFFSLLVAIFMAGVVWLLSRSPASFH